MAIPQIDKCDEYERYAEHCLGMAKTARAQESRVTLREMAAEWLKLADASSFQHQAGGRASVAATKHSMLRTPARSSKGAFHVGS